MIATHVGQGAHAMPARHVVLVLSLLLSSASEAWAQWTNRYPRNQGFAHHVYLEGYELPIMAAGVVDAAESRTGEMVVASRGWLWRLDVASGVARRLTSGAGVDSRPAWSRDGRRLAFVRDDSRVLTVVLRDMSSGEEIEVDRGMAMDPAFSDDGSAIYYTNASAGDLDLWRFDIATNSRVRVTSEAGLELRPQPTPDGRRLVYLSKTRAGGDQVRLRPVEAGAERVLVAGSILSQTRPALSPDGALVAYSAPGTNGWELRLTSTERPGVSILLAGRAGGRPIMPSWSGDGRFVYYVEGDGQQVARLYRIPVSGGIPQEVAVRAWEWGVPTGRVIVETRCRGCGVVAGGEGATGPALTPARLSATDAAGHPLIPSGGMARFDGQNGRVFFYSAGSIALEVPAGRLTVRGVQGLATPEVTTTVDVPAGGSVTASLTLAPLWHGRAAGWYSADHHFHLNYGGPLGLAPGDLLPLMAGEDLDVATPMLANLHNRFEELPLFEWRSPGGGPIVRWAQEVRAHFLGHVGLLGTSSLFWPWVWGPGYEVYGRDDRPNAEAIAFGRAQGGVGYYVHPVSGSRTPFSEAGLNTLPVAIVADAAHGNIDLLEIVCLWSNSVGTTELWYRLLNAGFPVAPSGGTDVMTDFHRTMAVGTTRVYVKPDGAFHWDSYFAALRAGRSFVTTGPMVQLTVGERGPGEVIDAGGREVPFALEVASAVPVDSVALVVNGRTVWSGVAPGPAQARRYSGRVRLPAGGWVAARVVGPPIDRWPAMAEYAFAHTGPIWIGSRGSTEVAARKEAAADLLRALGVAERRLEVGYAGSEIPRLKGYFAEARRRLEALTR